MDADKVEVFILGLGWSAVDIKDSYRRPIICHVDSLVRSKR